MYTYIFQYTLPYKSWNNYSTWYRSVLELSRCESSSSLGMVRNKDRSFHAHNCAVIQRKYEFAEIVTRNVIVRFKLKISRIIRESLYVIIYWHDIQIRIILTRILIKMLLLIRKVLSCLTLNVLIRSRDVFFPLICCAFYKPSCRVNLLMFVLLMPSTIPIFFMATRSGTR